MEEKNEGNQEEEIRCKGIGAVKVSVGYETKDTETLRESS